MIVMDAIDGLRCWRVSVAREQVSRRSRHPSALVRSGVKRSVAGVSPSEGAALLRAALHDARYLVGEGAVDAIEAEAVAELLPAVRPLLEDPHPHVCGAAQWALMDYAARMPS